MDITVTVFSTVRFLSSAYNQRNILIEIWRNHVLNHKITATVLKPAWHRFGDFSILVDFRENVKFSERHNIHKHAYSFSFT